MSSCKFRGVTRRSNHDDNNDDYDDEDDENNDDANDDDDTFISPLCPIMMMTIMITMMNMTITAMMII